MEKFIRNIDSDLSLKCNAECLSTIDTVTRWVSFAEIAEIVKFRIQILYYSDCKYPIFQNF